MVARATDRPTHVNGDDPEAVVHVTRVATEFRQLFQPKTSSSTCFCYRRFGHNEGDEPSFTQPLMYRAIKDHKTTFELYSKRLIDEGTLTQAEVQAMVDAFNKRLNDELDTAKSYLPTRPTGWTAAGAVWKPRPKATAAARPRSSSPP